MVNYKDYAPCVKVFIDDLGRFSGDWYFLKIKPTPSKQDIEKVVFDIIKGNSISFSNLEGKLMHDQDCREINHVLPKCMKRILKDIESQVFKIAIYDNPRNDLFFGQPVIISINPQISYTNFPDHPHLNLGVRGKDFLPASLCYTDKPNEIGNMFGDRISDAIFYSIEWLFRHQIWEKTRENLGEGKWIGSASESSIKNGEHLEVLNPVGLCRCSSGKKYAECCLVKDIELYQNLYKSSLAKIVFPKDVREYIKIWNELVSLPEKIFLDKFNKIFEGIEF